MLSSLFLQGWLIGFSIAMPVGPIGMLCIRHSLTRGTSYGLVAGLGAALADALYGALAGFGMTIVCEFLARHQFTCQLVGALFLCYLGVANLKEKVPPQDQEAPPLSFIRVFLMTFFLTLTNPLTILSFVGIYAALGIGLAEEKISSALIVTTGIFIGSAVWWLILSSSTALLRKKMNVKSTRFINQISGCVLFGFGILAALAALRHLHLF